MSAEFLLTALVVVLMPGTGVLYTLAIGLGRGFRSSVAAAFGCTLGILPSASAIAAIAGLATVFHTSALAFQVVKYAGVVWLLWMAWSMLRARGALSVEADQTRMGMVRIARNGLLLNVLNPKLSLFFLAFLPQFVPAGIASPAGALLELAAVFMAMTFVVFVGYGACAAMARDHVIARPRVMRWLRGSFAAAFGLLGLRLALAER